MIFIFIDVIDYLLSLFCSALIIVKLKVDSLDNLCKVNSKKAQDTYKQAYLKPCSGVMENWDSINTFVQRIILMNLGSSLQTRFETIH